MQEEVAVAVAEAAGGADHQFDFLVDSIAVGEAFAHALHMEELAEMYVWDLVPPRAEGPAAVVHGAPAGQAVIDNYFPAGPPVSDDDVAGAAQANANIHQPVGGAVPRHVPTVLRGKGNQQGQDVDMQEEEPSESYQELHAAAADRQIFAAAQAQVNSFVVDRAARAIAANSNQHAAPARGNNQHAGTAAAGGADRPSSAPQPQERGSGSGRVLSSASTSRGPSAQGLTRRRRQQQPVGGGGGGGEAITLRLETRAGGAQATSSRTVPSKEGIISTRQAMLAGAAHSPVLLTGIEEEVHENSWYDSILHEAQAMEAMDEPELDDEVPFQHQFLPRFDEEPREEEEPGYSPPKRLRVVHPCDLDLDEAAAGPSSTATMQTPPRVLPLADDEVPKFDCGICMETLPVLDLFHGMRCQHRFCVACMATYIEGRINDGEVPIPCPDLACPEAYGEDIAVLHPEVCKKSIDFAAFSSWGDRLTERAIPPNLRAYCPNRQCGVMLEAGGGKTPAEAFCPVCSHPMCATCGADWSYDADGSSQHDCNERPNAELLQTLADERRWKRCPRCKVLVEKIDGCDFMKCRYYIYSNLLLFICLKLIIVVYYSN